MFNLYRLDEDTYFHHVITRRTDPAVFFDHQHTFYEILLVVRGQGTFLSGNATYEYGDRTLFLVPPGVYHVISPPAENYERFLIQFSKDLLPPALRTAESRQIRLGDDIYSLFIKFDEYIDMFRGEALRQLFLSFLTEVMVLLTCSPADQIAAGKIPPLVEQALEAIAARLHEPICIRSLAEELFVSRSYLSHLFSETMHIGIMEYVRMKKMYAAHSLLKDGMPATAAARTLGYSNYSTFLRNYREQFHCLPSD